MWQRIVPLTDPNTSPVLASGEAGRAFDEGWARLERATGVDPDAFVEAAQWFHHGLRGTQGAPWVWLGLAEAAVRLAYLHDDEYEQEGIEFALRLVDRALGIDPGSVDAKALRAEVLVLAGRLKEGSAAVRGLPPDHWRVSAVMGRLCASTGNPILRRQAWRAAVKGAPPARKPGLQNRLATELFDLGRVEEALAEMQQAIALRPDHAWAHHNLATMFAKVGRAEEALASVQRARALADFPAARALEEALLTGAIRPKTPPAMKSLCAACGSPAGAGACAACGEPAGPPVVLSEVEIIAFRRVPCRACSRPMIGFATRCASCRAAKA